MGEAAEAVRTTVGPPVVATLDDVRGLLRTLPLGFLFVNAESEPVHANEALLATIQHREDDPLPTIEAMFAPDDRGAVRRALSRVARGEAGETELRARLAIRPDDAIPVRLVPATGLGRATAALVLADNREQLRLERQAAQAVRMQSIGQLAGGVAHDFNNILTAIAGHCDLVLARATLDGEDRQDVDQILRNADRAAALVRHLLAFSRQQMLRPRRVIVRDIVSGVVPLLNRLLGDAVRLSVEHHAGDRQARVDPGQLEQVIVNLAINARDAMPDGGDLAICTEDVPAVAVRALGHSIMPLADYVAITVRDSGGGVPPDAMGKIFEPFFTTKEPGRGTGLGLSTVYGIVKQTGGFIFARNVNGGGAEFAVYLPRDDGDAEQLDIPPPLTAKISSAAAAILLVEDETGVRMVAERALARAGHRVVGARDGEEALELFEASPDAFDMLVTDVSMPGMDGAMLAERVRERRPDLPVLLISGYAESPARRSIAQPRFDLLAKPFSMVELQQAVAKALSMVN